MFKSIVYNKCENLPIKVTVYFYWWHLLMFLLPFRGFKRLLSIEISGFDGIL